jgi:hypothetical protein
MTTHYTAADALKYAAAILNSTTGWALDSICSCPSDTSMDIGHEAEVEAIGGVVGEIKELAAQFGDPRRYSDGRRVKSSAEIERGFVTEHVWHPDPTAEQPSSHRGCLSSGDSDVPSPGVYEVSTHPATQEIHVRVVRTT